MRVLLDACVLYPTVMREVLLAVARAGLFTPLWSARLLEEWRRVEGEESDLGHVIAATTALWPDAQLPESPPRADLWLPDPGDIHVLESALVGEAEVIVTLNLRDFPRRELAHFDLRAEHPDAFLMGLWLADPENVGAAIDSVVAKARALSGEALEGRALLKRARLPRLGKAQFA